MYPTELNPVKGKIAPADVYAASPIKRRRATKDEMEERAEFLIDYAHRHGPISVRGLYYQAEVAGLPGIDKTENGYCKVQSQVLKLRREGRLSYSKIADATRWMRKPRTYDSIEDALEQTARLYRRNLWRDIEYDWVEIWCEKDALAGVISPVTYEYDVPLMVTRGYTSETFAYNAIADREEDDRPNYFVYYLGDFDRSGLDAARSLKEKLERFAKEIPHLTVHFRQIAITEWQIREYGLSTRDPKRETAADKKWPHERACELDALDPDTMRALVRNAIEQHLPRYQLDILKVAEESERKLLTQFVGDWKEAA